MLSISLEREGTVETYRFEPVRQQVGRTVSMGVKVANLTDGEVVTERTYSLDGASALKKRLQSLGFRA